jgi:alanine dehydrogenase
LIPVINHDAVLAAVSPTEATRLVGDAFLRHHAGDWLMPAKVYLPSPPYGDFRAMPARGDGLALLKWVSSFPGNPPGGVPTVSGVVVLSDAATGAPLALIDARAVTALRTGAAAAVAARALARPGATTVGVIGCGLNGASTARCMAAAGYGPGVCSDPRPDAAAAVAAELGWQVGSTADALACDVVCCITPGAEAVVDAAALRPGMHLNMLGADGSGKAEATIDAVLACELFCDEWEQASHGGELAGACAAGLVAPDQVTSLGSVLAEQTPGRSGPQATTLFDSTGLAIQDLAIGIGLLAAWRDGRLDAPTVSL